MREKIKGNMKRIIPVLMCFMLVFGSCKSVNASMNSIGFNELYEDYIIELKEGMKFETTYNSSNGGTGIIEKSVITFSDLDLEKPIYAFLYCYDSTNYHVQVGLFSKYSTSLTYDLTRSYSQDNGESWNVNHHSTPTINTSSGNISNGFYYTSIQFSIWGTKTFSDIVPSEALISDTCSINDFFNNRLLVDGQFDVNVVAPEHGGGGGSFAEYEDTPTGSIEPPKNLSIYRGYSTSDRQYKFQLQWDKPEDTELYTEINAQIHYKDGSTHYYTNYALENRDGWSAQDNKYMYLESDLLDQFFAYKEIEKPSVYNIEKLYVRFCKLVDGKFQYSLWRMVDYVNLDSGNGYDDGEDDYIVDSITGSFDENGNWINQSVSNGEIVDGAEKENAKSPGLDADGNNVAPSDKDVLNPDTWGIDFASVFQKFLEAMKSAISFIGEFPQAISEFFSFLPPWV